jgi:hypothetical protein
MKVIEFDTVFISYDEPNAEKNYADLLTKVPWAKRVHGVKGSDAAHKAAAELSETEWVVTVDADNIVDTSFFDMDLDMSNPKIQVYGWCGVNSVNNLRYGNGGLKIWHRDFIRQMKTHEASESDRAQVDFCWEDGYRNHPRSFSVSNINSSPYQAWRAGFREGVKMTLLDGVKIPKTEIKTSIWWHNLHRLKIWSTVGAHVDNGLFAMYGARLGTWMTNCTDWDYVQVRDFDVLGQLYDQYAKKFENDLSGLVEETHMLGNKNKVELGIAWPVLDEDTSKYVFDVYTETINLCATYYHVTRNV